MHLRMNDPVIVIRGKDKGERGEIIAIDKKKGRVKVSRRNMMIKHKKPNSITGEAGARVERENWLHASKVALYSTELGGPERASNRYQGHDGGLFDSKLAARASFPEGSVPSVIKKVRVGKKSKHIYEAARVGSN